MTALSTFTFQGFTLRPASARSDTAVAQAWTQADPFHRDTTKPEFWLGQGPGCDSYVLEDGEGIVFFFRMERTGSLYSSSSEPKQVELHIQFPPPTENQKQGHRARVDKGLRLGLKWLELTLALRGVTGLFFTTSNPSLARYAVKHLGFQVAGGRLVKQVTAREPVN